MLIFLRVDCYKQIDGQVRDKSTIRRLLLVSPWRKNAAGHETRRFDKAPNTAASHKPTETVRESED